VCHDSFIWDMWHFPARQPTALTSFQVGKWDDSIMFVPWLIHFCDITHSRVCHDTCICVPWLIHVCAMTHLFLWRYAFTCVPWHMYVCAMTYSCVCHDSSWSYVTCLRVWLEGLSHVCVCHDSFTCVPGLIHVCCMTHRDMPQSLTRRHVTSD